MIGNGLEPGPGSFCPRASVVGGMSVSKFWARGRGPLVRFKPWTRGRGRSRPFQISDPWAGSVFLFQSCPIAYLGPVIHRSGGSFRGLPAAVWVVISIVAAIRSPRDPPFRRANPGIRRLDQDGPEDPWATPVGSEGVCG